jgi:hypothetical protein
LALALVVLVAALWCSSGTLAPYAATSDLAVSTEPCHYLVSIDHPHFVATFAMLDGAPQRMWRDSIVLRRILFPLLAYPFMKAWLVSRGHPMDAFLYGGFLASLFVHVIVVIAATEWMRRRHGERSAIALVWLLATYPGFAYWGGLPYSYIAIVPCSLFSLFALERLAVSDSTRGAIVSCAVIGVLCTGYDLLPFFGVAAVLLLLLTKNIARILAGAAALVVPTLIVGVIVSRLSVGAAPNHNTASYGHIIGSYLHPDFATWPALLAKFPLVALWTFFASNFFVLPALFLAVHLMSRKEVPLSRAEVAVLIALTIVFAFNNLAPKYEGWQLRGFWIARIYQPLCAVFFAYLARWYSSASLRRGVIIALACALNALVIFGGWLGSALSDRVYISFYRHSFYGTYTKNIALFGARPLGLCSDDHSHDERFVNRPPIPME